MPADVLLFALLWMQLDDPVADLITALPKLKAGGCVPPLPVCLSLCAPLTVSLTPPPSPTGRCRGVVISTTSALIHYIAQAVVPAGGRSQRAHARQVGGTRRWLHALLRARAGQ